jgi:hypothetical protein
VECNVDIETQPKPEDPLTDIEQEGVPFSFIAVKQEVVSILIYCTTDVVLTCQVSQYHNLEREMGIYGMKKFLMKQQHSCEVELCHSLSIAMCDLKQTRALEQH